MASVDFQRLQDDLAARPNAPVLIVGSASAVAAARTIADQYIVSVWTTEFAVFSGRDVLIWPTADTRGLKAAHAVCGCLRGISASVKLITPDRTDAWDAAVALAEGWDWQQFKAWAKPLTKEIHDDTRTKSNGAGHHAENPVASANGLRGTPVPISQADAGSSSANGAATSQPLSHEQPLSRAAAWLAWGLDRAANGEPLANLNNAALILEHDAALKGYVWFDEFLQRFVTGTPPREWVDADDVNLQLYMQRDLGIPKMALQPVAGAVLRTAHQNPRNILTESLSRVPAWDRVDRLGSFFQDIFGAESTPYVQAVGRNFWLSLIARAYDPGCKMDNCVVLEGEQGIKKSTALSIIASEPWFAEAHEDITNKDFFLALQGKWLVEISEFDAFSRHEVTKVKQVVSCRVDRFRPPYGRASVDHPRRSIFVATTNKEDWNRDETGARRFWPVRCHGDVRTDLLLESRAQYLAEAIALYRAGAPWWEVPPEEAKEQQALRQASDPWDDRIETLLEGRNSVTVAGLLTELNVTTDKQTSGAAMRVGHKLTSIGWRRKQVRNGLNRSWVYFRSGD